MRKLLFLLILLACQRPDFQATISTHETVTRQQDRRYGHASCVYHRVMAVSCQGTGQGGGDDRLREQCRDLDTHDAL